MADIAERSSRTGIARSSCPRLGLHSSIVIASCSSRRGAAGSVHRILMSGECCWTWLRQNGGVAAKRQRPTSRVPSK
jgi:hypothetical protein